MNITHIRTRWAAIGAAIAVSLGAGGIGITHATTSSGERPIYLPIEPCRLADTRPAFNVGPRATPLGAAETYDIAGWGSVGNCTLPDDTAGLALNVTAIDPSAPTFLTLFPDETTLPLASHLNPTPGQPPTPNAVNVDLSDTGNFSIYNLAGNVHIAIDVVGIYDDHNHDDRYYTKTESDENFLDASQDSEAAIDGENGSQSVTNVDVVLASVTIDTPTSGYVVLNSGGYVFAGSGIMRCSITTGTTVDLGLSVNADVGAERQAMGTSRGFQINKALIGSPDETTYNLVCDMSSGSASYNDAALTAIFIPDPDAHGFIALPLDESEASPAAGDE